MKLNLKDGEHIRISHDHTSLGFIVYVEKNILHVKAKQRNDTRGVHHTEFFFPPKKKPRKPPRRAR